MPDSLLEVSGVDKHFGGVAALRGASLEVSDGEVHALMGENGAGKSTLARIVAGAVRADAGSFRVDGRTVTIASPLDAQRLGIGIIHQELDLFPNLSAGENMVIGNLCFHEGRWARFRRMETFCRPFLEQVGLACSVHQPAASLSIGHRQLLAIARALSMNARLLLMDEPTSSLFDDAVERLFALIRGLRSRGVSVVYVSHKMDEIFRIADRVTVLRDGQTVGTREAASTDSGELIRMMVGRELNLAGGPRQRASGNSSSPKCPACESPGGPREGASGDTVLQVEDLCTSRLRHVSFTLGRGEVLGVAGLVGAGRSELGAALFGLDRVRSGQILLGGMALTPRSPRDAMRRGIGLVPEDRRTEGLMMSMSVRENASLATLGRIAPLGFLRGARESLELNAVARQLALHCPSPETCVSHLSGGNQQKVLLARWLLLHPQVLFLDDPTRGIDVAAKQDIYRIIEELAAAGKAVILVSSELPELLRCCHRIMVLREGRVTATYDAAKATQEKIMAAATLAEAHA
jgi:ABC-type sugar transport system ATPase subunit